MRVYCSVAGLLWGAVFGVVVVCCGCDFLLCDSVCVGGCGTGVVGFVEEYEALVS